MKYQPDQSIVDYNDWDLATSSVITGDFTTDSLKYGFGPTSLRAESDTRYGVAFLEHDPASSSNPKVSGTIHLEETGDGLKIDYEIRGLYDGLHGFHIHEYGDLTDGCTSACAHFNPDNTTHGGLTSDVRHMGDLGNISSKNRVSKGSLFLPKAKLDGSKYGVLGRMMIVHADEDDLGQGGNEESLKTGNAGKRLACGVIGLAEPPSKTFNSEAFDWLPAGNWVDLGYDNAPTAEELKSQIEAGDHDDPYGNLGCPNCGNVDLFWNKTTSKGKTFRCLSCEWSDNYETVKSQGDITLQKFGLTVDCPLCGETISAYNRASIDSHFRKHKKEAAEASEPKVSEADFIVMEPNNPAGGWYDRRDESVTINLSNQGLRKEFLEDNYDGLFNILAHEYGHKVTLEDIYGFDMSHSEFQKYAFSGELQYNIEFAAFMVETNGDFNRSRILAIVHPACVAWILSNLRSDSERRISDQTLDDYFSTLDLENNMDIVKQAKRVAKHPEINESHKEWLQHFIRYVETGTSSESKVSEAEWDMTINWNSRCPKCGKAADNPVRTKEYDGYVRTTYYCDCDVGQPDPDFENRFIREYLRWFDSYGRLDPNQVLYGHTMVSPPCMGHSDLFPGELDFIGYDIEEIEHIEKMLERNRGLRVSLPRPEPEQTLGPEDVWLEVYSKPGENPLHADGDAGESTCSKCVEKLMSGATYSRGYRPKAMIRWSDWKKGDWDKTVELTSVSKAENEWQEEIEWNEKSKKKTEPEWEDVEWESETRRCCECHTTEGLTTIQAGTFCYDCLPINLGADSTEDNDFACTDYIIDEIKRIWYSPAQKDIKHWVEHNMAGDGLLAYSEGFDLPDGSELDEDTTKDEYFERMFDIFLERFEHGSWMYSDDKHGIMIQGDRVLYVPVGTPVNVDSLGNWENRTGDQYGVYGDKITSWLWSPEIYAGVIFGHEDIDHMTGVEGKDFDRIVLTVWVPWEAVDWASTIAFNISSHWQENELCIMDKEPVYELNFSRNEVDEASLDKAMNAEDDYWAGSVAKAIVNEMGDDYYDEDLHEYNCVHFAQEMSEYLAQDGIPHEIQSIAGYGGEVAHAWVYVPSEKEYYDAWTPYGVSDWKDLGFWETLDYTPEWLEQQTPESFEAEDNYDSTYGKAQAKIRRKLKNKIKKQAIMGTKAGQWSARKSQELKRQYEAACSKKGLQPYKGSKTKKQQDLSDWSKQKWKTASGKKSSTTGEPYFPAKAVAALKQKNLYAKAKRQKQAATKAGKQNARYSDDIRAVVKQYRAETFEDMPVPTQAVLNWITRPLILTNPVVNRFMQFPLEPVRCIYCGSEDITTDGLDGDGEGTVTTDVTCEAAGCGAIWRDYFRFVNTEVIVPSSIVPPAAAAAAEGALHDEQLEIEIEGIDETYGLIPSDPEMLSFAESAVSQYQSRTDLPETFQLHTKPHFVFVSADAFGRSSHVARFRSQTASHIPIIMLSSDAIRESADQYGVPLETAVATTVWHELGHVLCELWDMEEIYPFDNSNQEEEFAESIAESMYFQEPFQNPVV